jgi:hypothetical protein
MKTIEIDVTEVISFIVRAEVSDDFDLEDDSAIREIVCATAEDTYLDHECHSREVEAKEVALPKA